MEVSLQNSIKVVIDYYEGAYGPTLRIDVQAADRLVLLRGLLLSLAESAEREIRLNEIPWVSSRPKVKIAVLMMTGNNGTEKPNLKVRAEGSDGVSISWSGSPAYWKRCAGLVDGLLKYAPRPGHQYLTNETTDGILVELAFMETR